MRFVHTQTGTFDVRFVHTETQTGPFDVRFVHTDKDRDI